MSPNSQNLPLVTLAILSYRQEGYIAGAVRSVLDQDYGNLEVIISDDCSPDRTFEMIESICAGYDGPHRLVVRQNRENLGIGAHVSTLMNLAKGDLVILGAGDDLCRPKRVSRLVETWLENDRPAGLGSGATSIDSDGKEIGSRGPIAGSKAGEAESQVEVHRVEKFLDSPGFCLLGASAAWSPVIMETFGPLPKDVINEDAAFTWRSALLGGVVSIPEPLIFYRFHDQNIWSKAKSNKSSGRQARENRELEAVRRAGFQSALYRSNLIDLKLAAAQGMVEESLRASLEKSMTGALKSAECTAGWWDYSLAQKLKLFAHLGGGFGTKLLKLFPLETFLTLKTRSLKQRDDS